MIHNWSLKIFENQKKMYFTHIEIRNVNQYRLLAVMFSCAYAEKIIYSWLLMPIGLCLYLHTGYKTTSFYHPYTTSLCIFYWDHRIVCICPSHSSCLLSLKIVEKSYWRIFLRYHYEGRARKNRRNTTSQNIVGKGINKQEENKETEHNIYCEATIASNLIRQTGTYSTPSMCSSFW